MYAQRRDRRHRDRELQRSAANRRIGHDHAYLIVAGPPIVKFIVLPAVLGAGMLWVWFNIDHHLISLVWAALGVLCLFVYAAWFALSGNAHSRMMARAQGQIITTPWMWHAVAGAGVSFLTAAYLIYQP